MSRVVVNEIEAKVGNDISFNDTVKIDTIKGKTTAGSVTVQGEGTATTNLQQGLAKVWVDLDGTGTIAIDDSLNCTSATDNNTGNYTVTFTNSMVSATYSGGAIASNRRVIIFHTRAAGNAHIYSQDHNDGTNEADADPACFLILGDLA